MLKYTFVLLKFVLLKFVLLKFVLLKIDGLSSKISFFNVIT